MRKLGLATVAIFLAVSAARAGEWSLDDLNKTIDQTNFIASGGTATLISVKHRLVLTNHHVVEGFIGVVERDELQPDGTLKKIKRERLLDVTLEQKRYDGHRLISSASYQAEIVAHKKSSDLALLRIREEKLLFTAESRILPDDKKVFRGTKVYSVGNPIGLDATVGSGIISSLNRMERVPWADYEELLFIQFSGGIYYGNSGGALYSDEGYLIGVPAAIVPPAPHLAFAISYMSIKEFLKGNGWEELWSPQAETHEAWVKRKEEEKKKEKEARK